MTKVYTLEEKEEAVKKIGASIVGDCSSDSEPSEYWMRFLRLNNQMELDSIKFDPQNNKEITIDLPKIKSNGYWKKVIEAPMGQAEDIVEAAIKQAQLPPESKLNVRFINYNHKTQIRDLRVTDTGNELRSIACLVKRVDPVEPKITDAVFRCEEGHFSEVKCEHERIVVPKKCTSLGCTSRVLKIAQVRCKRVNRQFIKVQENLEDLQGGIQPSSLKCEVMGDLCNIVNTGERVVLNGFYRAMPKYKNDDIAAGMATYFEVNSIEIGNRGFGDVIVTAEDEAAIKKIALKENVHKHISNSIAPSILGMEMLKDAITVQLFGGVDKVESDGTERRGYINVLAVTDPGMAKTVMLKFVERVAPRGVYASALTSTKVGLVAPVVPDENGQYRVEAGPYMLASGGIFCLDEVSELSKDDFKYLGECMENGECHINKAGINAVVKTGASLLSACNPIGGNFDPGLPLAQQVKIPAAILSRFDIKMMLMDNSSAEDDAVIAKHMSGRGKILPEVEAIPPELLRKYVAHARTINPELTDVARSVIETYWTELRGDLNKTDDAMKVTKRQFYAIIRVSEAIARMRLSATVDENDAHVAKTMFNSWYKNVNTDKDGKINGAFSTNKGKMSAASVIFSVIRDNGGEATEMAIVTALADKMIEQERALYTLRKLCDEGTLTQPRDGRYRKI